MVDRSLSGLAPSTSTPQICKSCWKLETTGCDEDDDDHDGHDGDGDGDDVGDDGDGLAPST